MRQQSVKQMVEAAAIGGHDLRVIAGQLRQQKETKHAALAVSAEGQPVCLGRRLEALHQLACLAPQRLKKPGLANLMQCRQAAGCGHRVARQGAGLVDRPERRELLHHRALGAKCGQRHAPADHFTQYRHVGLKAGQGTGVNALCTTERDPKAGHHLVKHQQRAVLCAEFPAPFHEGD